MNQWMTLDDFFIKHTSIWNSFDLNGPNWKEKSGCRKWLKRRQDGNKNLKLLHKIGKTLYVNIKTLKLTFGTRNIPFWQRDEVKNAVVNWDADIFDDDMDCQ